VSADPTVLQEYALAAGLGVAVGAAELVSRYRDSPRRLLGRIAFYLYVLGNGGAAALTLLTLHALHISAGNGTSQAIVAGLGGMAILRSAFATVKVGDRDLPAGFGLVVLGLLGAVDRVIDRNQATGRSAKVGEIMRDVSFTKAYEALPAHCILLMANASDEDAKNLADGVADIAASGYVDQIKAYNLGVVLLRFAGQEVLQNAVNTLGANIKANPPPAADNPAPRAADQGVAPP